MFPSLQEAWMIEIVHHREHIKTPSHFLEQFQNHITKKLQKLNEYLKTLNNFTPESTKLPREVSTAPAKRHLLCNQCI